jgi:hypothetical protein
MPRFLTRFLQRLGFAAPSPTLDIHGYYFNLATQYYVTARWATLSISGTVAGNLFHHAVELYLKGDLSRSMPRNQLKLFGHNLSRLWEAYKRKYSAVDLSSFDSSVKQLHKFETIRYPDVIAEKGAFFAIPVSSPQPPLGFSVAGVATTPPTYLVVVNDIDKLIGNLFTVSSLNPDFCFAILSVEGRTILYRENPTFPGP